MNNNVFKPLIIISLLLLAIVLGIILPGFLFTENVQVFQIIFTILFISPIIYKKYKSDINTLKLMDRILYLSRHDDLTNIYNRRHFEELFLNTMEEALTTDKSFSLVYLDINNLKSTNDRLGHHAGDQAILTFSEVIKDNIRETDLFARYGGDEFIVVFFNIEKQLIKERIKNIERQLENNPIYNNGERIIVKFSYGISDFPEDAHEFRELIKIADERMYLDKKTSKESGIGEINQIRNSYHGIIPTKLIRLPQKVNGL